MYLKINVLQLFLPLLGQKRLRASFVILAFVAENVQNHSWMYKICGYSWLWYWDEDVEGRYPSVAWLWKHLGVWWGFSWLLFFMVAHKIYSFNWLNWNKRVQSSLYVALFRKPFIPTSCEKVMVRAACLQPTAYSSSVTLIFIAPGRRVACDTECRALRFERCRVWNVSW